MIRNSGHLGVAGILLADPTGEDRPVNERNESQDGKKINEFFHLFLLIWKSLQG